MTRIYKNLYFQVPSSLQYNWAKAIQTIDLTNFKSISDPIGRCLQPIGNWSGVGIDMILKRLSEEKRNVFLNNLRQKFGDDYRVVGVFFMNDTDNITIDYK